MEIYTAFILGLVGSLHCAGMCGPLALALPHTGRSTSSFLIGRFAYNFGRIITYCLLGIVFGAFGKTLLLAGLQRWLSIGLGFLLLIGLLSAKKFILSRALIALVAQIKRPMATLLSQRSFAAVTLLGLLNGFLPCGLVYVACAGATSSSMIIGGAKYMAAFGAGTLPMMIAISLSGKLIPFWLRLKLQSAIPVSIVVLATLLILRGMSLGIPYLSPNLSGNIATCCDK